MTVCIIDYGSGNLRSAAKAFERAARDGGMTETIQVTADPEAIRRADRLVLPGVGAFADCKAGLDAVPGLVEALSEAVIDRGRPFLGICVGMQLLADVGREHADTPGLGWIAGEVVRLTPKDATLKVPHMGWNQLQLPVPPHALFDGIGAGAHAYFVHSYHFRPADPRHCLAEVDYGGPLAAVVGRDNMLGTQFHPEKSQATGQMLIANFLRWTP